MFVVVISAGSFTDIFKISPLIRQNGPNIKYLARSLLLMTDLVFPKLYKVGNVSKKGLYGKKTKHCTQWGLNPRSFDHHINALLST